MTISTEPLIEYLLRYHDMPFSDAIDLLCQDEGGDNSVFSKVYPNIFLDAGLSQDGVAAAEAIHADDRIDFEPLTTDFEVLVVYGFHGSRMIDLPICKTLPPYQEPHWMPGLIRLKS